MLVDVSKFSAFHIADLSRYHALLERFPTDCSHYNFAALFCWQDAYSSSWQIVDNHLLILNGRTKTLLMPLGPELTATGLFHLSQHIRSQGLTGTIAMVPPQYIEQHPELDRYFRVSRDRDNADYIYSAEELSELRGRKLSRKRNQIHQFLSNHPDHVGRELQPEEWPRCHSLAAEWSHKKHDVSLNESPEANALQRAFKNCRELGIHGFGLFVAQQLVAFSIWSRQNRDMATVHFEKYDPELKGAAQMINRETARHLRSWARWINREQDLGIAGLRRAKLSYLPDRLLSGFTIELREPRNAPKDHAPPLDNPA